MHLFSQFLSIVLLCWGQMPNVTFSVSSAGCIQWPGTELTRVSCRCVIYDMLQGNACCARLIRTRITVCSISFYQLLPKFDNLSYAGSSSIGVWSIKVENISIGKVFPAGPGSNVEWPPYTVFDTGMLDGFKGAVKYWLLQWVVFSSLLWGAGAGACGVAKAIINNFVFHT